MTFSIIARDPESGLLGVAVSTAVPCVGAMVPHVKAGVGAIATQSYTNIRLGVDGLRLLEAGRDARRSAHVAPRRRRPAASATGRCHRQAGPRVRLLRRAVRRLVRPPTRRELLRAGQHARWPGHDRCYGRVLRVLEGPSLVAAAQGARGRAGGREATSAVASPRPSLVAPFGDDPLARIDIRVDLHDDPVAELRRIFNTMRDRLRAEAERAGIE